MNTSSENEFLLQYRCKFVARRERGNSEAEIVESDGRRRYDG